MDLDLWIEKRVKINEQKKVKKRINFVWSQKENDKVFQLLMIITRTWAVKYGNKFEVKTDYELIVSRLFRRAWPKKKLFCFYATIDNELHSFFLFLNLMCWTE